MLRSILCDYSDACIVVKWTITVEGDDDDDKKRDKKKWSFKNIAQFRSCIQNTVIDNAEDFDVVMRICNFLEYSGNYYDIRKFVELL